jgi:hypothetical protein|tara:strand:+ start:100 stop:870 length:771 start_codon:yes stop_codon:yes gene_type:complete
MNITVNTYLLEIKKKIYFILGFLLLVTVFHFSYGKINKAKYNLSFTVNLYELRVMYSMLDRTFDRNSLINNLLYNFEKKIAVKFPPLKPLNCHYTSDIITCEKVITNKDGLNYAVFVEEMKENLSTTMRSSLNNLFSVEMDFIDSKIEALQLAVLAISKTYEDIIKNINNNTSEYPIGAAEEIKMKQEESRIVTEIQEYTFLKKSLADFQTRSKKIDIITTISKKKTSSNFIIIIIGSLLLALIIVFLSIKEEKTQ